MDSQLGERHGCGWPSASRLTIWINCTPNQHTADHFRSNMQGFSRTFCSIAQSPRIWVQVVVAHRGEGCGLRVQFNEEVVVRQEFDL
jgi:hypothetical protein